MKLIIFSLAAVQAAKVLTQQQKALLKQDDDCEDTNNGQTDSYGDGCDWYDDNPSGCGSYDTDNFSAATMCCGCQYSYEVSNERQ